MNDTCIFCEIISGRIPSKKVFEDSRFLAILDIAPWSKGHTILLPKRHSRGLLDTDDSILAEMLPTAKKIASVLKKELKCGGMNLLQNNEPAAGQTIFHLHMHILPRYKADAVTIHGEPVQYADGEMEKLIEKLEKDQQEN